VEPANQTKLGVESGKKQLKRSCGQFQRSARENWI